MLVDLGGEGPKTVSSNRHRRGEKSSTKKLNEKSECFDFLTLQKNFWLAFGFPRATSTDNTSPMSGPKRVPFGTASLLQIPETCWNEHRKFQAVILSTEMQCTTSFQTKQVALKLEYFRSLRRICLHRKDHARHYYYFRAKQLTAASINQSIHQSNNPSIDWRKNQSIN